MQQSSNEVTVASLARRNLRFGWWLLLGSLSLGIVLEALHGFKVGWYLDVVNETRRLQWTLAHTHGTLIGVVNIVFALTLRVLPDADERRCKTASFCLTWSGMLMPTGFLLGGLFFYGSDPGLGVVLVPIGGVLLFWGVLAAARAADSFDHSEE